MARFVPKDKLSKKARRELDNKQRRTWQFCPATKSIESKKVYNRKRKSRDYQDDWNCGIFVLMKNLKGTTLIGLW